MNPHVIVAVVWCIVFFGGALIIRKKLKAEKR
jgi:hypothetical protein